MRVMDTQSLLSTKGSGKTCGHFWRNSYCKGFPSQHSGAPSLPQLPKSQHTSLTWSSEQHRRLPSTDTREGSERGPEGTAGERPGFSWPGEGPGSVQKKRWGNPPLPILSVLRLSQRPALGLQKLQGNSPLRLPLVSCQGPTLQPQYFSRFHSDTHKWRRSKPNQKKCGCGQAGQEPWALCQPWQMGLTPLHTPFLY